MTVVLGIIASLLLFAIVAIIMIIAVFIFLICNQCLQGALSKMFAKNTQQLLDCAQVMQNMFSVGLSKNTKNKFSLSKIQNHLLSLKNIHDCKSPLSLAATTGCPLCKWAPDQNWATFRGGQHIIQNSHHWIIVIFHNSSWSTSLSTHNKMLILNLYYGFHLHLCQFMISDHWSAMCSGMAKAYLTRWASGKYI